MRLPSWVYISQTLINALPPETTMEIKRYLDWFTPYGLLWSESLLLAAIEFIYNELGISKIFTHTARSGWQIKKIGKHWWPLMSDESGVQGKS